jgi:hypothetical protein
MFVPFGCRHLATPTLPSPFQGEEDCGLFVSKLETL